MSDCNYTPLFARVIIKREVEQVTKGGIILPDAKRHAKAEGVVVALGPTADESISLGDRVIFGRNAGTWLDSTYSDKGSENDDGTLFMCQDEDILAKVA